MQWWDAVAAVKNRAVRLATPGGHGSGFILPWKSDNGLIAIATAAHVISHAHYWEQPIRVDQTETNQTVLLRMGARAIFLDEALDTAILVFTDGNIVVPDADLTFVDAKKHLRVGCEVGWLGYPGIANELCLFSGRVSAWRNSDKSYLVDAVSVHGVSGGLVFDVPAGDGAVRAVGTVSAYIANRATGEALPGLAVAHDVSYFHDTVGEFKNLDDAIAAQSIPTQPPSEAPEAGAAAPAQRIDVS